MAVRQKNANLDRMQRIGSLIERVNGLIRVIAQSSVTQLVVRCALAVPFWRSGVNKWDGFLQLNDVTVLLFSQEFSLHLPGGPYPYPAPAVAAFASGVAEIVLPILLVTGLATRISAFALLIMTLIVQITIPTGWPVHVTWAAMALGLMAWGPGRVSLDALIGWLFRARAGAGDRPAVGGASDPAE